MVDETFSDDLVASVEPVSNVGTVNEDVNKASTKLDGDRAQANDPVQASAPEPDLDNHSVIPETESARALAKLPSTPLARSSPRPLLTKRSRRRNRRRNFVPRRRDQPSNTVSGGSR